LGGGGVKVVSIFYVSAPLFMGIKQQERVSDNSPLYKDCMYSRSVHSTVLLLKTYSDSACTLQYEQFPYGLIADRQLYRHSGWTDSRERLTVAGSSPHTRTEYVYLIGPF
jgi:hypothetical protein